MRVASVRGSVVHFTFMWAVHVLLPQAVAQAFAGPIVAQLVLFAGYLVTVKKLADWSVGACQHTFD
jgi:hypothetical protein